MTDEQFLILFVAAAAAFALGLKVGEQKAAQAQSTAVYPGTGADAMSWFANWGGLGRA